MEWKKLRQELSEAGTLFSVRSKCVFVKFFLSFDVSTCLSGRDGRYFVSHVVTFFVYKFAFATSIALYFIFTSALPPFASHFHMKLMAFLLVYFNYLVTQFVTTSCEFHFSPSLIFYLSFFSSLVLTLSKHLTFICCEHELFYHFVCLIPQMRRM